MNWYVKPVQLVDEYSPADLDALTEELLLLVRPEPREPLCERCGAELEDAAFCSFCGYLQGRKVAA